MAFKVTVGPDAEPLSLSDAKYQLPWPQTDTSWDLWIQSAIVAARQFAEAKTQKTFVSSTVLQVLDGFPAGFDLVPFGEAHAWPSNAILLETAPVQSVTTITYLDMSSTLQTVDPTTYAMDLVSEPARITPSFGKIWPIALPQIGSVNVTYQAGYGEPVDVPEGLKAWMKMRIGALWQNREEIVVGTRLTIGELPFVDGMLDNFRVVRF